MSHAQRVLEQLAMAEEMDDLDDELQERIAKRREELEAEVGD